MHEVPQPDFIDALRHSQGLVLLAHQAFAGLYAQVQFQLVINALKALMVPAEILDVAKIQVAQAKSPVAMVVCQPNQPIGDDFILSVFLDS